MLSARASCTDSSPISVIDPTCLSGQDAFALILLLADQLERGKYTFTTKDLFPYPVIDDKEFFKAYGHHNIKRYTQARLTRPLHAIMIRSPESHLRPYHIEKLFHIEVQSGHYLSGGRFEQIPEVTGSLQICTKSKHISYIEEPLYTFTPTNLTPFQSHVLFTTLQADLKMGSSEKVFRAMLPHRFGITTDFRLNTARYRLTQILIRRLRESVSTYCINPDDPHSDFRYEIMPANHSRTRGKYGEVRASLGVLKPCADGTLQFNNRHARVVKIMSQKASNSLGVYKTREWAVSKLIVPLNFKHPVFNEISQDTLYVMNRISGMDIHQILSDKLLHTTQKRLESAIACVHALAMLHLKKIRHRDIKPANIMLNIDANPVEATFIDFGLSALQGHRELNYIGTPIYSPPELFDVDKHKHLKRPMDEKCDIFSLGWVLALLFGADRNPAKTLDDLITMAKRCVFTNLFNGISDLTVKQKFRLQSVLQGMVKADPEKRYPLETVLEVLERILLERKQTTQDCPIRKRNLNAAFSVGLACREAVFNTLKEQQHDVRPDTSRAPLMTIVRIVSSHLKMLEKMAPRDESAFAQFLSMQHLKCLRGLKTREEVIRQLSNVIQTYMRHHEAMLRLSAQLMTLANTNVTQRFIYLSSIQLMKSGCPLTLDELHLLGQQYAKCHAQIDAGLSALTANNPATTLRPSVKRP